MTTTAGGPLIALDAWAESPLLMMALTVMLGLAITLVVLRRLSRVGGTLTVSPGGDTGADEMTIKELWVYPLKSGRRCGVAQAKLLDTGLQYDRSFMVVTADGGEMVRSARSARSRWFSPASTRRPTG